MIKHVIIKDNGQFIGRYGVKYENNWIEIRTLAGEALPLRYLMNVVTETVEWYINRADEAHKARQYPWRVKYKKGSSGCYDFWVESLIDPEWGIIQRGRKLHLSMYLKLNEGLNIKIADLAAILDHPDFPEEWFQYDDSGVEVKVINIDNIDTEDFNPPGTNTRGEFDEEVKEEVA